jgi:hypothetical protein
LIAANERVTWVAPFGDFWWRGANAGSFLLAQALNQTIARSVDVVRMGSVVAQQARAHGHITIKIRARTQELPEVLDSCKREPSGPRHEIIEAVTRLLTKPNASYQGKYVTLISVA